MEGCILAAEEEGDAEATDCELGVAEGSLGPAVLLLLAAPVGSSEGGTTDGAAEEEAGDVPDLASRDGFAEADVDPTLERFGDDEGLTSPATSIEAYA